MIGGSPRGRQPPARIGAHGIFLSYATPDRVEAARLQQELERFRLPRSLVGTQGRDGPLPDRLGRVFMDRTDLSAALDIANEIEGELARSQNLVVLCSNSAADPKHWVGREISAYRRVRPDGRIFAVILRDEPPGCFPAELLTDAAGRPTVPLAGDRRPQGDGQRDALLKLVAGITGIGFDLLRRQRARALRRRRAVLTGIGIVYATTVTAAFVGVGTAAIELVASRNAAIADRAKAANEAGRGDVAMLLAATALPAEPSWIERSDAVAEAQAVRALLGQRVEELYPSGGATLSAWSPTQSRLFLAAYGGEATAVDVGPSMRPTAWHADASGVTQLAVSSDGKLVALAVANGIIIADASTGAVLHRSPTSASPGRALAFSPDGKRLAVGRQDGGAQVWRIGTPSWGASAPLQAKWPVAGIAFSSDGSRVLSAVNPNLLEWDADTGRPLREIAGHGTVTDIGALDDHNWEVSYDLAKVVSVLSATASAPERLLALPQPAVRVRASSDGTLVAAATWDGSQAIVANAGSGAILATLQHAEWVDDAILLPGSGNVLTLSRDGYLRSWRNPLKPAGQPRTVLEEGGPAVMARGSGGLVYLGGGGPGIAEFDTVSGTVRRIATLACKVPGLTASRCWITGLRVLQPAGDLLYAAADGRIGRIDPVTGKSRWQRTLDAPINGLGVYPGEFRALLAVGADRLVGIDLGTGDIATPGPPGSYEAGTAVRSIAFAPSSDRIATTDSRGLAIRRASDAGVVWRAPVYDRIAITAAWLPAEGLLAAGTAGDTIQLFPAQGGTPTRILRGHTSWVTGLSVRPGGRYLASISNNEAIVWDIQAGQAVLSIPHEAYGGFTDVVFDADGQHLTLSDSTGSVRRVAVPIPNGDLKEALCRAIPSRGRSFSDSQMREFGFLRPADRNPCQHRSLISHALLGGLFP